MIVADMGERLEVSTMLRWPLVCWCFQGAADPQQQAITGSHMSLSHWTLKPDCHVRLAHMLSISLWHPGGQAPTTWDRQRTC